MNATAMAPASAIFLEVSIVFSRRPVGRWLARAQTPLVMAPTFGSSREKGVLTGGKALSAPPIQAIVMSWDGVLIWRLGARRVRNQLVGRRVVQGNKALSTTGRSTFDLVSICHLIWVNCKHPPSSTGGVCFKESPIASRCKCNNVVSCV